MPDACAWAFLASASVAARPFCQIALQAGFGGIVGPGYPDHDDHTHVDTRSARPWSAPNCGI